MSSYNVAMEHASSASRHAPRRGQSIELSVNCAELGLRGSNATFELERDYSGLGLDCLRADCIGCQGRFLRQISVSFLGIRRWPDDPFWSGPSFCGTIPEWQEYKAGVLVKILLEPFTGRFPCSGNWPGGATG